MAMAMAMAMELTKFLPWLLCIFSIVCITCMEMEASAHHRHHRKQQRSHRHGIAFPPASSANVFDVRSFGAAGDGSEDDTEAFKMAWDAACEDGAGVVLAPEGYTFVVRSTIFAGPCRGGVVLRVDGVVAAPDGPDAWPPGNSRRQWLVFYRADGMVVRGRGTIDGRGEKWWDLPCKPHRGVNGTTMPGPCDSPAAVRVFMSSNVTVRDLSIRDSPQFHLRFDNCRSIAVDAVTITAPPLSPNTDGIHVENTRDVTIRNSVISNGDDCISIGAGSVDVDIRNVTCGPGHGISIGSLGKESSRACVSNVSVRDAVIRRSENGLRIKTWQGGSGWVTGVRFSGIEMDGVRNPIIVDQYYCLEKPCANQTSAVYISDVSYVGIRGTYDVRSPPMHLACSDPVPCTNITIAEVELLPAEGTDVGDPFCWNVYGESPAATIPPVACLLQGVPKTPMDDDPQQC